MMKKGAWHSVTVEEVYRTLSTGPEGIEENTATARREEHGVNEIPPPEGDSVLRILLRQVESPLIWVLLLSAVLAILLGKITDGIVVTLVIVSNVIIGAAQELRASRAMSALMGSVPIVTSVIRHGTRREVPARELVPGDVVLLASGDRVPADVRLVATRDLRIDESALTGESLPVEKSTEAIPADSSIGDRTSIGHCGCHVISGTGTGVVVETGTRTELGKISGLLGETTAVETPITRQLAAFSRVITIAICAVAVLLTAVSAYRGLPTSEALLGGIAVAVAAIPEGLPAVITITLAIGVQRMSRRHVIVRYLPAAETLGSTSVICSDKTGTLTRNEMTVTELWTPSGGSIRVDGVGYAPEGKLVPASGESSASSTAHVELIEAAVLCSDATLFEEEGRWSPSGDPTEAALVVLARKAGLNDGAMRKENSRLDVVPFESERKYMASLHRRTSGSVLYLKGSPEVLVPRCAAGDEEEIAARVREMAATGLRVLAVVRQDVSSDLGHIDEGSLGSSLSLLGLIGMTDPPRPEAIEAVRACRAAGIRVKMITGDHPETARAIGTELGLIEAGGRVMTGKEIEARSPAELEDAAAECHVFARVAPADKLALVRALQARGQVVAMTGDGVNDAPALRQADVGVAMGITGTAVSKEAADIVLTDDNFASIVAAVEEGRRAFDNIRKSLAFILPTNLGLALIFVIAVLALPAGTDGRPLLPLEPVQILWVNLIATVTLALALAFEDVDPTAMSRAPRDPHAPILDPVLTRRVLFSGVLMALSATGLFLYEYRSEVDRMGHEVAVAEARTMAVTTVILFQMVYLLRCRTTTGKLSEILRPGNPWVLVGILALAVAHGLYVYWPLFQDVFRSQALNTDAWIKCGLVTAALVPLFLLDALWESRRSQ